MWRAASHKARFAKRSRDRGDKGLKRQADSLDRSLPDHRCHGISVDEDLAVDDFDQHVTEPTVPEVAHDAISAQRKLWFEADNVPYMMFGFWKHASLADS